MTPHRLDRVEARRLAVSAQLLAAPRPTDLLEVVRQLTILQVDPTAAIAPSADLIVWTRLGSGYRPAQLTKALEVDRTLYEVGAMIRPVDDLRINLAGMRAPSHPKVQDWLTANAAFHTDVLALLRESGPLLSRDIPDTSVVPWPSSGWTNNRNVTQLLEFLLRRGEVAVAARQGRQRVWDLPERVYPSDVDALPLAEAEREKNERRVRALGIVRPNAFGSPGEQLDVAAAGEPATVDGIDGEWRVDPEALDRPFRGRTALLSPFDRLVHDRDRAAELFDFEYTLEMYKPKGKRRWGYFALPILHGDRLVGKLDAKADRKAGELNVFAVHEDVRFTRAMTADVTAEIEELAAWQGLKPVRR